MSNRIYFLSALLFAMLLILVKNEVTYRSRLKIIDAIFLYSDSVQDPGETIRLIFLMEPYFETFSRSFDWGCKNILPEKDYLKIKPYIRRRGKKNAYLQNR